MPRVMDLIRQSHDGASAAIGCEAACCASGSRPAQAAARGDRAALVRQAIRLEYATIAWMVIEAAVAIGSGIQAGSVSLLAFGVDSLIEIGSAGVLVWRLTVELRHGQTFAESAERRAGRIAGALLFALAAYVVAAAGWNLWMRSGQAFSWPGLVVTALAIPAMALLARRKLAVAGALGSGAMRADAMEAITCGWLSVVVVMGLIAEALIGAWWIDSVTSLAIVWLLVGEGREAWNGACRCD